jgi:hypothetical protein
VGWRKSWCDFQGSLDGGIPRCGSGVDAADHCLENIAEENFGCDLEV